MAKFQPMKVVRTTSKGVVLKGVRQAMDVLGIKPRFVVTSAIIPKEDFEKAGGANEAGVVWVDFSNNVCRPEFDSSWLLDDSDTADDSGVTMTVEYPAVEKAPQPPLRGTENYVVPVAGERWMVLGDLCFIGNCPPIYVPHLGMEGPFMLVVFPYKDGSRRATEVYGDSEWRRNPPPIHVGMDDTYKKGRKGEKGVLADNIARFGPRAGDIWVSKGNGDGSKVLGVVRDGEEITGPPVQEDKVNLMSLGSGRTYNVSVFNMWYKYFCLG